MVVSGLLLFTFQLAERACAGIVEILCMGHFRVVLAVINIVVVVPIGSQIFTCDFHFLLSHTCGSHRSVLSECAVRGEMLHVNGVCSCLHVVVKFQPTTLLVCVYVPCFLICAPVGSLAAIGRSRPAFCLKFLISIFRAAAGVSHVVRFNVRCDVEPAAHNDERNKCASFEFVCACRVPVFSPVPMSTLAHPPCWVYLFPGWSTPSPPCIGYVTITFNLHVEQFLSTNRRHVLDFVWDPNQSEGESPEQTTKHVNKRHGYAHSMLPRMSAVIQEHVGSSRSVHRPLPYFIFVTFNFFALSHVVFVCCFIPVLVLARRFCWLRLARPRVDVTVLILAFRLFFRGGLTVDTCYVAYVVGMFFAS